MTTVLQDNIHAKRIAKTISIVIVVLASINGIFTFTGAQLFIQEMFYAALFAVAVQFAIAITLIALPYVKGLGKLVLLVVYVAALSLSMLAAYTYIYNAGLPGNLADTKQVDTHLKARVADQISDVIQHEQTYIDKKTERLAFLKRQAEEEAKLGLRSGLGAGKGREYYRKMEQLQADEVKFTAEKRKFNKAQTIYDKINLALESKSDDQRDQLILLVSQLNAIVITEPARDILVEVSQGKLAVIESPVERAMSVILDRETYSIQLIISIVWAAVFDLLALFLGIIRYYILQPQYSILNTVYDSLSSFITFFIRLRYLKKDAHQKYHLELQKESHRTPLNSSEMQSFATYIMAGSLFSATDDENAIGPLQNLISHIEPLKLDNDPQSVGIPFDAVDGKKDLKTLMAMLIQNEVFITDVKNLVYILNPGSDMANKILVFIKMGLQDSRKEKDLARYMLTAEASA